MTDTTAEAAATTAAKKTAAKKTAAKPATTVTVRAVYPFCDCPVGATQTLWGITFEHIVKKQDGEDFHFLIAELDVDEAKTMQAAGRVSKFE